MLKGSDKNRIASNSLALIYVRMHIRGRWSLGVPVNWEKTESD